MSPLVKPVSLLTRRNLASIDLEASSSQYLSITDAAQTGLDLTGDFTIEMWAKFETIPGAGIIHSFIDKWYDSDPNRCYLVFNVYGVSASSHQMQFLISGNGLSSNLDAVVYTDVIPDTTNWYHWAITCDISAAAASQFELFRNASSLGNGTVTNNSGLTSIRDAAVPFQIGRRSTNNGTCVDALVDDVRVWNVVRTQPQIAGAYQSELVGNEPGLVAYYKFNDNPNDSTANGNDLTPVNGPTYSTDVPFT